jgi:hypothetical protein
MTRQLVFVHGRSQQGKDSVALKQEWVDALKAGLAKSGLDLPIGESDIRFPYYGDTLYQLVQGHPDDEVAEVIVRGDTAGEEEKRFIREMILEIQHQCGLTDEQVEAASGQPTAVNERGIANWGWVQKVLEALDRHVPGASGAVVAVATRDVYLYLKNPGFQNAIDSGVRSAFDANVETVVVGHSLGSVVSYNLLRSQGHTLGWKIPLYVTVGAPLAVTAIKDALHPCDHPPCVGKWFNAMDHRDVVSLYPLDADHFPVDPLIENKTDVDNPTENRHGISGYLSDPVVAKRIHEALTA